MLCLQSGEIASVLENTGRHEDASASDASTILKLGNTGDETPAENNGEYVEAASAQLEDNKDVFDGEEQGDCGHDDSEREVDDIGLDCPDAVCPSNGGSALNGEDSEDYQNDADPQDSSEPANEIENERGEEAEINATDDAEDEINVAADDDAADDSVAAADAETEEPAAEEHSDLPDAGPCEPSSEDIDAAHGSDMVDAPSPMDVDVAQPFDTGKALSDAGCDGAMEVEYPMGAEDAGGGGDDATSCNLGTESVNNQNDRDDRESPMAEDGDENSSQSDQYRVSEKDAAREPTEAAEKVSELRDVLSELQQDAESELQQDAENIASHSVVSDAAEYDEVDALQSKVSQQSEVSESSRDVDESGNTDGLVEGDDFTVELQPDTSEQESAASELDQSVSENEVAEKTGVESESRRTEESNEMSDDIKTTESDGNTALPPASSDAVCICISS